jgi:hypothetical protein
MTNERSRIAPYRDDMTALALMSKRRDLGWRFEGFEKKAELVTILIHG